MASKKSRRRRAELEKQRKKTLFEKKGAKIGIILIAIVIVVAVAVILINTDVEESANTIPEAFEDYPVIARNSENNQIEILSNDVDGDNDSLSITEITNPSHGSVEIDGEHLVYTPDIDFSGVDNFEYTIDDGNGGTDTAIIHVIVADENPISLIDTTMGMIVVELYEDKVPNTVENFIKLANDGFYTDLVFHRVANLIQTEPDTHVIQGGGFDIDGVQKESPYGTIDLEINETVRHVDGAIAMARTPDPNSATSQFYICDGVHEFLNDDYAAFGVVIEGIDVVRSIANVDTTTKFGMQNWPEDDVIINSITIENQ